MLTRPRGRPPQGRREGDMTINLTYAKTITKQAGIKQNYQSLRNAYDKRDLKNIILNACLYLLINEHLGMNSLELAI